MQGFRIQHLLNLTTCVGACLKGIKDNVWLQAMRMPEYACAHKVG